MPYKNKEDKAAQMRRYRERHKTTVKVTKNRLAFLEAEIKRLQKCLEVALSK